MSLIPPSKLQLFGKQKQISFFKKLDKEESKDVELSPTDPPKPVVSENIYVITFNNDVLNLINSTSVKERIKACKNIGHLVYSGGTFLEPKIRNDSSIIDILLDLITGNTETPVHELLKMQAMQTLTIFCRCGKSIQGIIIEKNGFSIMRDMIFDNDQEMKKWAIHGMIALAVKNYKTLKDEIYQDDFVSALQDVIDEDWAHWDKNDAAELEMLISLF